MRAIDVMLQANMEWIRTLVKPNANVKKGDLLGIYRDISTDETKDFVSTEEGRVEQILVSEQDIFKRPTKIIVILKETDNCSHDVVFSGLCAICGCEVENIDNDSINLLHGSTNVKITASEASRMEKKAADDLLNTRKLSLVVDLDQTILHATIDPQIGDWLSNDNHQNHIHKESIFHFSLKEYPNTVYYIKKRPKLEDFLEKICKIYELHIYTMGARSYAEAIARNIDPDKKYFGDRILSRDENELGAHKSVQRLFPYNDFMVAIIDDRPDVWQWCENLVPVRPYVFFEGTKDINAPELMGRVPAGTSFRSMSNFIPDNDQDLDSVYQALSKLHQQFYHNYELKRKPSLPCKDPGLDVKHLLPSLKHKVLAGCTIVMSGLVPLGLSLKDSYHFKIATEFGAVCQEELDAKVTHLVAKNERTEKVKTALKNRNIKIVNPDWLFDSIFCFERCDESYYAWNIHERGNISPLPQTDTENVFEVKIDTAELESFLPDDKCNVEYSVLEAMNREIEEALASQGDEEAFYEEDEYEDDGEAYDEHKVNEFITDSDTKKRKIEPFELVDSDKDPDDWSTPWEIESEQEHDISSEKQFKFNYESDIDSNDELFKELEKQFDFPE